MNKFVAVRYQLYWGRGDFEEFDKLIDAVNTKDHFINCCGGDDDEYIPPLYAVLGDGTRILLQ